VRRGGPWLRLRTTVALAAAATVLASCGGGTHRESKISNAPIGSEIEFLYRAQGTPQLPTLTRAVLERAVATMRERLAAFAVTGEVNLGPGPDEISLDITKGQDVARAVAEVGANARLEFYDWEANALLPNGTTVASELRARYPRALQISQGAGEPGAGGMSLYMAVKLASRLPAMASPRNSRIGSQYYLFGSAGSPACAAAARFYGVDPARSGEHCLLSGPDGNVSDLISGLPPGVRTPVGTQLVVRQGTVVLEAVPSELATPPKPAAPSTRFYVLRDDVALFGDGITSPEASTDAGGDHDLEFGLTPPAAASFTRVTAAIAKRGAAVSRPSVKLFQHFAVALDDVLLSVPEIDFDAYPDGVPAGQGAEITGGFTAASARDLALELRLGELPVDLVLVLQRQAP